MGLSVYMKGDYEEFYALKAAKNKANSKPIKANQSQFSPSRWLKSVEAECEIGIIKRKQKCYEMEIKYAFESSQFR